MELYIMILTSVIVGFIMGRQTVQKPQKTYKIPRPKEIIKEHKQKVAESKELAKYTTIMENIENYDGTGSNQKDVPL